MNYIRGKNMNFLRLLSVLGLILFCLCSCGPDQNKAATPGGGEARADAASIKALMGPKWCVPVTATPHDFSLSWNFRDDGTAFYTKTKLDNRQIIFNLKYTWIMRSKTLTILKDVSGVEVLKKDLSFALDLATGKQVMTWADPAKSDTCDANGNCSSTSIQAMTLTECE
jgi:hypothetical protein